jgi:riboflavin biosynthesis pyrimidine reductase
MAISLDGYIARENDDTSWISVDEWDSYSAAIQKAAPATLGSLLFFPTHS